MGALQLLATAVALALDALAVAIAAGIGLRAVSFRQTFRLSFHFGFFQALMPVAGWLLGESVYSLIERFDHWVAFVLLMFVGGKMILEGAVRGDPSVPKGDPTRGGALVMLSIATSIDALAVGFSLAMLRVSIWWPALVIGITALLFTAAGMHVGGRLGSSSHAGRYAESLGGVVLIVIGCVILHEHGVF